MSNENVPQPLDLLMTKLGLSNADLVNASTEQLSFKMVQKGRTGRRLTINVQEKILRALLAAKSDLKIKRRELFCYEPGESVVEGISNALTLVGTGKIKYPEYIDLLAQAGIHHYAVDVAAHRVTFYGFGGEAHVEQGPAVSQSRAGTFYEPGLRAAIKDAQEGAIDYPTFLKRIYEAGIGSYEVNIRQREIRYRGEERSYKETIPLAHPEPVADTPKPIKKATSSKIGKSAPPKRAVRTLKKRKVWKAVKLHRVKVRQFKRH